MRMGAFFIAGALLGLSAGISPGPLLTLVISQALRHGIKEGAKVAAAPLVTDLPLIGAGVLLLSHLSRADAVFGAISLAGGGFVFFLGVQGLRQGPLTAMSNGRPARSILKGVLVNLLNPHPYLFWFTVGVPMVIRAWETSAQAAAGFLVSFFGCIVGSKVLIAVLAGRSRRFLTGRVYVWTVRVLGGLLILFSLVLFRDGLRLLGVG